MSFNNKMTQSLLTKNIDSKDHDDKSIVVKNQRTQQQIFRELQRILRYEIYRKCKYYYFFSNQTLLVYIGSKYLLQQYIACFRTIYDKLQLVLGDLYGHMDDAELRPLVGFWFPKITQKPFDLFCSQIPSCPAALG